VSNCDWANLSGHTAEVRVTGVVQRHDEQHPHDIGHKERPSQLYESLTSQPVPMLKCLDVAPFSNPFRSLDLTSQRHLKELRLDRK
jgi:hypothetical protein